MWCVRWSFSEGSTESISHLPPLDAHFAALGGEGKLVLLLKGDRHDRFDARLRIGLAEV